MVVTAENPTAAKAAELLLEQAKKLYPNILADYKASWFYRCLINNDVPGIRAHQIRDGEDKGKLTLEVLVDGVWKIDPRIKPVDCYNPREGYSLENEVRVI